MPNGMFGNRVRIFLNFVLFLPRADKIVKLHRNYTLLPKQKDGYEQ
jgi:hypothetical protein